MATRLHFMYHDLAQLILALPPVKVRLVVIAAAKLALQNAGLEDTLLQETLAAVDGREMLQPHTRNRLLELQWQLDDRYLAAQDSPEGQQELPPEALQSFHRARALAAVLGAIGEVDATGAAEVVYEAIASSSDEDRVAETIQRSASSVTKG